MMNINYPSQLNDNDFQGIIDLQQANLDKNISSQEAQTQGFVSVEHDLVLLKRQAEEYPHIIAKHNEKVVGYALVMLKSRANTIPLLVPMFELIERISIDNKPLSSFDYFVMGQVCVDKDFRGQGIFDELYKRLAIQMSEDFDYIVTEIDAKNIRSQKAHQRVGFEELHRYTADNGQTWVIVGWNIKSQKV